MYPFLEKHKSQLLELHQLAHRYCHDYIVKLHGLMTNVKDVVDETGYVLKVQMYPVNDELAAQLYLILKNKKYRIIFAEPEDSDLVPSIEVLLHPLSSALTLAEVAKATALNIGDILPELNKVLNGSLGGLFQEKEDDEEAKWPL